MWHGVRPERGPGLINLRLPQINGGALAKSLVRRQMKRKLDTFLSGLGEARLRKMVEGNIGFAAVMPAGNLKDAAKYRSILKLKEGEPLTDLLPDWALALVGKYGLKGQQWLQAQEVWLRHVIGG